VDLRNAADRYGISSTANPKAAAGGLDGLGSSYAAELLGSTLSIGGEAYTLLPPDQKNAAANAMITLPSGTYSTLNILGTAVRGNQTAVKFTVHYQDGTSTDFLQSLSDWRTPQHYIGEMAAKEMTYKRDSHGLQVTGPYYAYSYMLSLNASKVLQSVTLPPTSDVTVLAITVQE
jgi:hypothetical protein